jgi:hypothetical protein
MKRYNFSKVGLLVGQIWFKPNFEFRIYRIKSRKRSEKCLIRFRSDFEFGRISNQIRICPKIQLNVEKDGAVRDISA